MVEELKQQVYLANMELVQKNMVIYTWGNVSGIDREQGLIVIKPSGVAYEELNVEDMVVLNLDGEMVEGELKPSSDTATHIALYKAYPSIGGIVHTHSVYGVTFAQAGIDIPPLGTTHADYFHGSIPCTRSLTEAEIDDSYELNTGRVIIETIGDRNPLEIPGIVVKNHGPFAWGTNPSEAVYNGVVLEKIAEMAYCTLTLNPLATRAAQFLLDKHYYRKHGAKAYYGQINIIE